MFALHCAFYSCPLDLNIVELLKAAFKTKLFAKPQWLCDLCDMFFGMGAGQNKTHASDLLRCALSF